MEILGTQEILGAIADGLGDWRKLAQPLATRYRVADTASGAACAVVHRARRPRRQQGLRLHRPRPRLGKSWNFWFNQDF